MNYIASGKSLKFVFGILFLNISSVMLATAEEAPISLGSAGDFAVLASSTISNVAQFGTVIIGDAGVSPGTELTGFPPGTVVGAIHAGDSMAANAQADLATAYDEAAGRSNAPATLSGNLGGTTLFPGLYRSTSSLEYHRAT